MTRIELKNSPSTDGTSAESNPALVNDVATLKSTVAALQSQLAGI
jgi:hypothetical protein